MKKYWITYFLLLVSAITYGQSFDYGNSWYTADPTRPFIKIMVDKDGLYKLTKNDLINAGHSVVSSVDATKFRLYYRGKEVPICIFPNNTSTQFDYIYFLGKKNNASVDSLIYKKVANGTPDNDAINNMNISLFTDTSAYFLTWVGGTGFPKRYLYDKPLTFTGTPEASFWYEAHKEYLPAPLGNPKFSLNPITYITGAGGNTSILHVLNSDYTVGEGYTGPAFAPSQPFTVSMPTPYAAATQPTPPIVKVRVFGRSESSAHLFRLEVNNIAVFDTSITSVYSKTFQRNVPGSLSNTTNVKYSSTSLATDNSHVCWTTIGYWRSFNLNGDSSIVVRKWNKPSSAYFSFANASAPSGTRAYAVSANGEYLIEGLVDNAGNLKVIIPQLSNQSDIFVLTELVLKNPVIAANNHLSNLHSPTDGGAELVIITHRAFTASATAYKNYRDTCTFNPIASCKIVYVDEIYDEYSYGSLTPLAIKRFCKDALDNWTNKPKYFFLWGKGSYMTRGSFADDKLVPNTSNFVPTYGYPATDYEFISRFGENEFDVKPEVAIGRVNIFNDAQGMAYLTKVNAYEHTPWNAWMKRGVLLGGGETDGEQSNIGSTLKYCKKLFEAAPFGGDVFYYQKTSSLTIDPNASEYHDYINNGTTIIHFFGHSSSNISDIALREATEYNNYGRVPFILAEGCYGGDFATYGSTFGERWIIQPEKGGIGYIANSSEGFLGPLQDYAEELYPKLFGNMLGDRIGDVLKAHINDYGNIHANSAGGISNNEIGYRNNVRQMNLQGDPLVRLHTPSKPDLAIDDASIYFQPQELTAFLDSFKINIIIKNLGLILPNDSFTVSVRQRFPSGDWLNHPSIKTTLSKFINTVSIQLLNPVGSAMTGPNTFEIYVDSTQVISEYSETNNFVSLQQTVAGNIPAPIFPIEYAVIPDNQVTLVASSYSITRDSTVGYLFEIDTLYDFTSPFRLTSSYISTRSNYASWNVPTTLKDSTVYYWRVRLAQATPSVWAYSTFRYIQGKEGWAQAKSPQFRENKLHQVELDVLQKEWKFSPKVTVFQVSIVGTNNTAFSVGQNIYVPAYYYTGGIQMAVVDQYDVNVKFSNLYTYSQTDYTSRLQIFKQQFLGIQNGDYFFIASNQSPRLDLWPEDIFDFLEQQGVSSNLHSRPADAPFIIYGRKGYPNSIIEVYSPIPGTNVLRLDKSLYTNYTDASITSPQIGPSMGWHDLIWKWKTQDPQNREKSVVNVYGVRQDGTDSLVLANITTGGTYDLSFIPSDKFPFLYLKTDIKDTVYRTAPQLDNWHILYDLAPDAIIDPFQDYSFISDSLEEGEDIYLNIGARNPTKQKMDSLLVAFKIERENRSMVYFPHKRFAKLPENGRINISKTFGGLDTLDLDGKCRFFIELNPNHDQREQYAFNNLYVQDLYILQDRKNPILDVTFDGKHITDQDITSPTPEIAAQLKDENLHLAMDDTTTFEVRFAVPGPGSGLSPARIYLNDPRLRFEPASLPNNKAKLYFYPGKIKPLDDSGDGYYRLQIQGKDARGNLSGKGNSYYDITFKVVNEKTITNVLNYPNPFSTSTRFVYTLTGNELPDFFQIHIYTITGKLVKIIDLVDLGEMHFGKNITNYAWDGTDEYGDKVGNGVYLYRIISKSKSVLKESSLDDKTDKMFKGDWGKMYIMR